ncbi:hypothetical protein [Fibrella forsythiae]|uniref:DUF4369 domain-containing protein n=1 Tax=Fibrella forsythiae TaxID=2817061 RepID=A0ABS3JAN2_9BACT|nr:hypothetical protein [Fibrella forsythiae]MBO0947034.1 hypothetical protein [Fibrella forsythiae]
MKSILFSLLLAAAVSTLSAAGPIRQSKRDHPTKLVHFEVGALITGSGKLRVNVDKQLGGLVYIQLMDRTGRVFFNHTIYADEEFARLNLDLSRLSAKEYTLKVSNGLEMITRDLKIDVVKPVEQTRSVTLL